MRSACAPSGCEPGASPQGAVTRREILFTVIHCTGGEPLITASALALAAFAARAGHWPFFGDRMALTAILLGLDCAVLSEWPRRKSAKAGPTLRRSLAAACCAVNAGSPLLAMADRAGDRPGRKVKASDRIPTQLP
jgi:hypothetical protein